MIALRLYEILNFSRSKFREIQISSKVVIVVINSIIIIDVIASTSRDFLDWATILDTNERNVEV